MTNASPNQHYDILQPRFNVRLERSVRIPMRDGMCLSADLFLPDAPGQFPTILEYSPYRKDDVTRAKVDWHWYFAERGFAGVRLDVRGTGGSEGINTDEYMPQEQEDGCDAVEWIASQPWCNSSVGMFGTSYAGFTAIQVAMHRPPHLKAIAPLYASDDRYTDDCHYTQGGNMRMYYDVGCYGGMMAAMNALPPYPELSGPEWERNWKQRLEQNKPYLLKWIAEQVDGPYWRHASLRPGYHRIQCPVFLVGGWRDGYANPMLRMYSRLQCPKRLLMGPWVHSRPNVSVPGPRINFLHEVLRFFSRWMAGEEASNTSEPAVMVYMQQPGKADRTMNETPGCWLSYPEFPIPATQEITFYLREKGALSWEPGDAQAPAYDEFQYLPALGTSNGYWSGGGLTFYLADDQRPDEACSAVYTSPPFEHETFILGWPEVTIYASSSARVATFVAKLADVASDGSSTLIVDGSLNGTRRESVANPSPMTPGHSYQLKIPMSPTGWVLAPGHRVRLAISGSDFPNVWPTPEPAQNRVYTGGHYRSRLVLPIVSKSSLSPPEFLPPPQLREVVRENRLPASQEIIHDHIAGTVTLVRQSGVKVTLDGGLGALLFEQHFRCSTSSRTPEQAGVVSLMRYQLSRTDGVIEVEAESTIRATKLDFHVLIDLTVKRNGANFFNKKWEATEPRRLL